MDSELSKSDIEQLRVRVAALLLETMPQLMRLITEQTQSSDEEGTLGLTQIRALGHLRVRPLPPGELARALRVTPAAASELVETLVRRGLVERNDDPHDRRAKLLSITKDGLSRHDAARARALAVIASVVNDLDPDAVAALDAGLPSLIPALQTRTRHSGPESRGT